MDRTIAAIVVALACALPGAVRAAPPADGNDWLSRCQDAEDAAKGTYCFTYARGLADGLSLWAVISPQTAPACIPTQVQGQELVDVGMRYLKSHPEMGRLAAGIPLAQSFVETWPCQDAHASGGRNTRGHDGS